LNLSNTLNDFPNKQQNIFLVDNSKKILTHMDNKLNIDGVKNKENQYFEKDFSVTENEGCKSVLNIFYNQETSINNILKNSGNIKTNIIQQKNDDDINQLIYVRDKNIKNQKLKKTSNNINYNSDSNRNLILKRKKNKAQFDKTPNEISSFDLKMKGDASQIAFLNDSLSYQKYMLKKNSICLSKELYKDLVVDQKFNISKDYIKYYKYINNFYCNLSIHNEVDFFLKGKRDLIVKPKKMMLHHTSRSYIFPSKDPSVFSCQKISIIETNKLNNLMTFIKGYSKIVLISLIFIILWIYIAVFIKSIYQQYSDDFFKVCIMPIISIFLITFVFTTNFMLFITSSILYIRGKSYVNTAKNNIFVSLIFKTLVPSLALNHFDAIITYQKFVEWKIKIEKKKFELKEK